jgi:hypothetical protein
MAPVAAAHFLHSCATTVASAVQKRRMRAISHASLVCVSMPQLSSAPMSTASPPPHAAAAAASLSTRVSSLRLAIGMWEERLTRQAPADPAQAAKMG